MNTKHTIPEHIAIIMDGNRRWAKERGLPPLEGHRRVADSVLEPLIEHASGIGVKYLTLWAWSTENWKRTAGEVSGIMKLLRWGFSAFGERMHKKGIRIRVIGDMTKFPDDIRKTLEALIEKTKDNTAITVIFALNYGGRDEMFRAMQKAATAGRQITCEKDFASFLDTDTLPDPDMIVRTGGEYRLSGFLLWQCAYSELMFVPWHMPDFTPEKLDEVVEEFSSRKRRYGK